MALTDIVAILTHHALATPMVNKMKNNNPLEFYAVLAFPPAAATELSAIATIAANGAPLSGFEINIPTNATANKPIPGVPGDYLIVRAASQFPPFLAAADGTDARLGGEPSIRSMFFAGSRVRAALSAYAWNYKGKAGISFNLNGIMDAGEVCQRLAIGNPAESAFQKYAVSTGVNPVAVAPAPASEVSSAAIAPAEADVAASAVSPGSNPFAQPAAPARKNPFA